MPNASFQCSLDTGTADYQPCTSPYAKPSPLADGAYTFRVRATDQAGNTDPAATEAFTIDTVAPSATITSPPHGTTDDNTPSFDFSSSDPNASFQCSLDTGTADYQPCTSPYAKPSPLANGAYTFRVRATDQAGNTGPAATEAFTIDTVAPSATITSPPHGTTDDNTPSFDFSSSDPNSTFQCSLDTGTADYQPCTSPYAKPSPLANGTYTFRVQATDQAGNTDPAATGTFTVDTVAPRRRSPPAPDGSTDDTTPSFDFSSNKIRTRPSSARSTTGRGRPPALDAAPTPSSSPTSPTAPTPSG